MNLCTCRRPATGAISMAGPPCRLRLAGVSTAAIDNVTAEGLEQTRLFRRIAEE